ncbi:unnamed protein product [Pleuronectes platessa]|uniref:Uncharacterized protein n=1 Tax=Pleuronectes platessa TaxID=8262 RepID=A0A9N7VYQ0_PLEPL|nr:unnamed protein product [Pleuronectes platessa]
MPQALHTHTGVIDFTPISGLTHYWVAWSVATQRSSLAKQRKLLDLLRRAVSLLSVLPGCRVGAACYHHMAVIQLEAHESGAPGEWSRSRRLSSAWCKILLPSTVPRLGSSFIQTEKLNRNHFKPGVYADCSPSPLLTPLSLFLLLPLYRLNHPACL